MIEQEVMDQIIHVPTEEEAMEEKIEELRDAGFVVTNFSKGGIFYTILYIVIHVCIQMKELAVDLINSAFMAHCPEEFVEVRAADFSKSRKEGIRTEGYVTVYRTDTSRPIRIAKGHPFRTETDAYGNYLRYYALEETVLPEGAAECRVPVQAEAAGTAYNVASGKICYSMVHIEGSDQVKNVGDWITVEGQEEETIESLRQRCLNSRAENAERTVDMKIKSLADSVPGVVVSHVDSQHPRGQGTVDVIVTGSTGAASEKLLADVMEAIEPTIGSYGDYLVKSSTALKVDIDVDVYIEKGVSTDGYAESIQALLVSLMDVQNREELNTFYLDSIRGVLASSIKRFRKCTINSPAKDIEAGIDTVIVLGETTVHVYNIS